ncbi:putative protein arginine n-methyltransferase [Lasius niger]|uniref:Protein arginine N-methyltransferase domain-containing protein n=1 Tax=Lasius niger TaxID=67767 RepID=A0A0J7L0T5_LASNI|nr:putative protein arginine n-methyltransferase [Lasius niger]
MDQYFKIYQKFDIHRLMLTDKTCALMKYKNVIFKMRKIFEGILSIFCAEVGAKKVYAVEASTLANIIEQVSIENNLQDTIKVIHSKVEDIHPDSLEKIDIIVSLWMGFCLINEGMLDSVLFARDNFLRRDGLIFPFEASLHASPCQLPSMYKFGVKSGVSLPVYLSMRCIGKEYRKIESIEESIDEPVVLLLNRDNLLPEEKLFAFLDLRHIPVEEVNLLRKYKIFMCKKDGKHQGICIWFKLYFPDFCSFLSTAPYYETTHWKQTVFVLPVDTVLPVNRKAKERDYFACKLELKELNLWHYKVEITLIKADDEVNLRDLATL